MADIRCLDPHLADLIAAGEVVERPASAVKELVENAVDAGASVVTVEIRRGGMELIRVSDNGCGIPAAQLPTAFLRHATSKLREESDLAAIGTLGFRGEALAAIAAVSQVEIVSRCGALAGARLSLTGGFGGEVEECGAAAGTEICVRELFFNTPARLKFMKKDSAESAAVHAVLQQLALSHPELSLRFLRDGEQIMQTPGDGELLTAVYAALGRDFALSLQKVRGSGGSVRCEGFVTKPLNGRGSRGMQVFFVNGRLVKSPLLTSALEEGYRNRLLKGKFPGCVLHLTLPAQEVDVNVHPAKTVVKFLHEKAVFDAVYYTVLDALEEKPQSPAPVPLPKPQQKPLASPALPREGAPRPTSSFTIAPPPAAAFSAAKKTESPAPAPTAFQTRIAPTPSPAATTLTAADSVQPFYRVTPQRTKLVQRTGAETAVTVAPPPQQPAPPPAPREEAVEQQSLLSGRAPWRIVGEVCKTYIVCEDEEGTVHLIDKHAAHERIIFDRLKAGGVEVMRQVLLAPVAAELGADACAALLERQELMEEFGFACEDFGAGALLVRQIPADIDVSQAAASLEMLAEEILSCRSTDPAAARDAMLHTVACKAAIKAGMNTSERELRALVEQVQSGAVRFCPHGRPVAAQWSKYQLEKMFRRA